jgi:hypothetical protein
MTPAVLEGDYRTADAESRLNLERTVDVLKHVEPLLDSAL